MTGKSAAVGFEKANLYGSLSGTLAGAGLSALASWLYYRRKKNQSFKKRLLKAIGWSALGGLGGGVLGSYLGRMYARHSAYKETLAKVKKGLEGTEKKPGRVIYVDCIDNRHIPKDGLGKKIVEKVTNGGVPTGHAMLAVVDEKTDKLSLYQVNTAEKEYTKSLGIKLLAESKNKDGTFDRDKAIMGYNAIRLAEQGGTPILNKTQDVNMKGLSDDDLALYIGGVSRDLGFEGRVVLHEGEKCDDIRVPVGYLIESYNNTLRDSGGGYSPIPGGYNCGTAAREAFDIAQPGQASHWRDMLWGGGSTANAPSGMKSWSNR